LHGFSPLPLRRTYRRQLWLALYRGTLGRFIRATFQQRKQIGLAAGQVMQQRRRWWCGGP
jgi:hypothetical protein